MKDRSQKSSGVADFAKRLHAFRDRLPADQQPAFQRVLAGARATFRRAEGVLRAEPKQTSLVSAIANFRKELPAEERDALDSILTASAFAWGVHAGRLASGSGVDKTPQPPGGGPQVIAMDLEELEFAWFVLKLTMAGAAVILAASYLVAQEITSEEDEVPDLSGIPPGPP